MTSENSTTPTYSEMQLNRVCQALFDSAAEGLVVVDEQGRIVMINGRASEMLGYAESELIGAMIEKLIPSRYTSKHVGDRQQFQKHPTRRSMGIGMDLTACRKDGSEFPVEISLNHFELEGVRFVMALISDITKRKATEIELEKLNEELEERVQARTLELAESQLLYSVIARNFPNGIIMVFDREFNYVFAEGRELFKMGVTSQELVGTNYLSRLAPDARETIEQQLEEAFEGKNVNLELVVNNKNYELHAVPLRDATGAVTRILVVEMNVTQHKLAEQNIMNALEKERQLNELKSRFVSMASHEFRTPLSTILTSLSLAVRYDAPEQEANRLKHYNRIRNSVHNLTSILNDFLSLDKLESGKITSNPSEFDLGRLLEDLIDEMRGISKEGQVLTLAHTGEIDVCMDQNMLRNVMVNLMSNAIKYSAEHKPVDVRASVKEGKVRIEVQDYGIGIPEGDQIHMFERFFRSQNAVNIQGTGLGLNIVKKYLDLMRGDIWFESVSGSGSTFIVVLPQNLA